MKRFIRPHQICLFGGIILLSFVMIFFASCEGCNSKSTVEKKTFEDKVVVRFPADPTGVHPHNTVGAPASEVKRLLHLKLLEIDHETLELVPFLAKDLPVIEKVNDGKGLEITYKIREEAKWDDGTPITADDVEFSIKALKNTKVNAANMRPYFEFIVGVKKYPDDPKKITFLCDKVYHLALHVSGTDSFIIPKHIYDPEGLYDKISFDQVVAAKDEVMNGADNMAFANMFNHTDLNREPSKAIGGGAYTFKSWETGVRLKFERKSDWWGDQLKGVNMFFDSGPKEIVFEVITDVTTAIAALKAGKIDVLTNIPMKDWLELPEKSKKYSDNFDRVEMGALGYAYMGYNLQNPKLKDKRVRHAINHLADIDKLIEQINYGVSTPVSHTIFPEMGKHIYKEIPRRKHDVEKAKQLLKEAGWGDENGNGVLDKRIDGELTELELSISYMGQNTLVRNWVLAFQESFKEVGIKIITNPLDWSVLIEGLQSRSHEMWMSGFSMDTRLDDPKQLWHTESINGGTNYTGFGNDETDKLIEEIGTAVTKEEQTRLFYKWQDIIFEEAPVLFLFRGKQRISYHKRFSDIKATVRSPGYHPGHFQLDPNY